MYKKCLCCKTEFKYYNCETNRKYCSRKCYYKYKIGDTRTFTIQHRINLSKANKGKKLSEDHKRKIGLKSKGRKHSEYTKKIISEKGIKRFKSPIEIEKLRLYNLGKKLSEEHKKKIGDGNRGKKISMETRIKHSLRQTKEKEFTGFKTPENKRIRLSEKYKNWREQVFSRDDYTCQKENCNYCGNKKGVYLHPHHIKKFSKYVSLIFNIDNGITYCKNYHLKSKIHKESE